MRKDSKGDAFVREKTGSAPLINLDGQREQDFVDDNTPAGEKACNSLKKEVLDQKSSGIKK